MARDPKKKVGKEASEFPLPPFLPRPMTDEEADDLDYLWENYDLDTDPWQCALGWAKKGDFDPLINCLRFIRTAPPDEMAVRNFLASVLDGSFKKPRNSKSKRNRERIYFEDAKGRRFLIDKRHLKQATAIKRVRELQTERRILQDQAIEIVASEMDITKRVRKLEKAGFSEADATEKIRYILCREIAGYLQNPRPEWGLSRPTVSEMFGEVLVKPTE